MSGGSAVHVVVPQGFEDPLRTSGGNVYDRHLVAGLRANGWTVHVVEVGEGASLDAALPALPARALAVIDGLVAGAAPSAIEAAAQRLRIVVLAHMVRSGLPDIPPREAENEARALRAACCVIATSEWTRREAVRSAGVLTERIAVAVPGTAEAPAARGSATGGALLCVGVVAPHKGQDLLVHALLALHRLDAQAPWTCTLAGSLTVAPAYVARLRAELAEAGLAERVRMPGVLTGDNLDAAYDGADLVVAPSRTESYGMAVADALGRGIPVLAAAVGGIPENVRDDSGRSGAAILVPADQPGAFSAELRRWLGDPERRARLKDEALRTRARRPRWSDTVGRIEQTLAAIR